MHALPTIVGKLLRHLEYFLLMWLSTEQLHVRRLCRDLFAIASAFWFYSALVSYLQLLHIFSCHFLILSTSEQLVLTVQFFLSDTVYRHTGKPW